MIYLDAGATTLQKPSAIRNAMANAVSSMSSPGRGSHVATVNAEQTAFACRREAASFFDVKDVSHVVFTANATHGLNIAIRSLVKPGSRVVITGYEHNAVTRVLHSIPGVEILVLDTPLFAPNDMLQQLNTVPDGSVSAMIANHVSNVFGYVTPMDDIAEICRKKGIPLIVDASQSAGHLPVSMTGWGAAFIAMPGHKGLYGPQGTGLLLCGDSCKPLLCGGTGTQSLLQDMPAELPDRLEPGTHNMPGIAGLLEGLRFVQQRTSAQILQHERELIAYLVEELRRIPGLTLFYEESMEHQSGVLSLIPEGYDCQEVTEELSRRGIAVRAGLHCAPLAHKTAKTIRTGTIRLSPSVFNTKLHMHLFTENLKEILREKFTF